MVRHGAAATHPANAVCLVIFKPVLAQAVMEGRKVETRRVRKPDEMVCRYRPMKDYAVQPGRGKAAIGRIVVESVEAERLGEITDEAAYREGFLNRDDFEAYWEVLHGHFDPDMRVWVIRFALLRSCARCGRATPRMFSIDPDLPAIPACDHICLNLLMQEAIKAARTDSGEAEDVTLADEIGVASRDL